MVFIGEIKLKEFIYEKSIAFTHPFLYVEMKQSNAFNKVKSLIKFSADYIF